MCDCVGIFIDIAILCLSIYWDYVTNDDLCPANKGSRLELVLF